VLLREVFRLKYTRSLTLSEAEPVLGSESADWFGVFLMNLGQYHTGIAA
jgi:hypothetical protein